MHDHCGYFLEVVETISNRRSADRYHVVDILTSYSGRDEAQPCPAVPVLLRTDYAWSQCGNNA